MCLALLASSLRYAALSPPRGAASSCHAPISKRTLLQLRVYVVCSMEYLDRLFDIFCLLGWKRIKSMTHLDTGR